VQHLICHVNLARGFRGGERQTELLIRHLAGLGVTQMLVGRRHEPLLERLSDVADLSLRPEIGNALGALRGARGATVIHAHESHGAHGAYLRHLLSGTPYLITRRVMNVPGSDFFTHRVYRHAAVVAAISQPVAAVIEAYEPSARTTVIPSVPADLAAEPAEVEKLRKRFAGRFLIGHVAALDHRTKGQMHVIEAARRLADRCPEILFLLIGGGADERWLREEARGLNNLEFTGFVDNVGDFLAVLDLLILPSLTEGLGSILLDAMQFGVPVIASRVGGVPEIVIDGETGLLIEPASAEALASAIQALLADERRRCAFGEAGRRFVLRHTAAGMARRYVDVYAAIAGGPG